jgi:hypothetical protein
MQRRVIAPVLLAVLLCGTMLMVGCPKNSSEIVFSAFTATPNDSVLTPSATVTFMVAATNEDNDPITFTWSKSAGALSATTGDSVVWTAPNAASVCTVSVKAIDDDGSADTSKVVRVGN